LFCLQQDLITRGICTEPDAVEIVNKKFIPIVSEQQQKFEKKLESFDVSRPKYGGIPKAHPRSQASSTVALDLLTSCTPNKPQ